MRGAEDPMGGGKLLPFIFLQKRPPFSDARGGRAMDEGGIHGFKKTFATERVVDTFRHMSIDRRKKVSRQVREVSRPKTVRGIYGKDLPPEIALHSLPGGISSKKEVSGVKREKDWVLLAKLPIGDREATKSLESQARTLLRCRREESHADRGQTKTTDQEKKNIAPVAKRMIYFQLL